MFRRSGSRFADKNMRKRKNRMFRRSMRSDLIRGVDPASLAALRAVAAGRYESANKRIEALTTDVAA